MIRRIITKTTLFTLVVLLLFITVPLHGEDSDSDKQKVILDVDMGQLNDDAVTMFMLLQSGKVDVLGMTVVSGNTWVEAGTAYTLRQLELIGREDIPVYAGVGVPLMGNRQKWLEHEEALWGNSGYLGAFGRERPDHYLNLPSEPYGGYPTIDPKKEHAVDFIIHSVKEHPGEVTMFVLGPAMNLALAIREHPEIIPKIKQVYYMGGAYDVPGNSTPAAEFNWWFCPESIRITLRAPFERQVIVPLDIAEAVYYTREQYERIAAGPDTPLVQMFRDHHGPRFENNPDGYSNVWDVLTAAIFLRPEIATGIEERYVDIDVNYGMNYGRSVGWDERHRRSFDTPEDFPAGTQKVEILMDIDREAFWELYIDLMTRPID